MIYLGVNLHNFFLKLHSLLFSTVTDDHTIAFKQIKLGLGRSLFIQHFP